MQSYTYIGSSGTVSDNKKYIYLYTAAAFIAAKGYILNAARSYHAFSLSSGNLRLGNNKNAHCSLSCFFFHVYDRIFFRTRVYHSSTRTSKWYTRRYIYASIIVFYTHRVLARTDNKHQKADLGGRLYLRCGENAGHLLIKERRQERSIHVSGNDKTALLFRLTLFICKTILYIHWKKNVVETTDYLVPYGQQA